MNPRVLADMGLANGDNRLFVPDTGVNGWRPQGPAASNPTPGRQLQTLANLVASPKAKEWQLFEEYIDKSRYKESLLSYAKKYCSVLQTGDASPLLSLKFGGRRDAMSALANLSKSLGLYSRWKAIRLEYQLKWSDTENSDAAFFERYLSGESDLYTEMKWLKDAIAILPEKTGHYLMFTTLTGLRPDEAVNAINYIKADDRDYMNKEKGILEHFRHPETFFRKTKKAYISLYNDRIIELALDSDVPSWAALRSKLNKRGMETHSKYCRSIYGTYVRKKGVESEIIDILQGRVPRKVFARHYFHSSFTEDRKRVLSALEGLAGEIMDGRFTN